MPPQPAPDEQPHTVHLRPCGNRLVVWGAQVQPEALAAVVAYLFLVGLLAWSLAEYLVHRFVLHRWFPVFHMVHHKDPLDGNGVPYVVSLTLTAVVLMALGCFGFFGGVAVGYLAYVTLHEGMHRWRIEPGHILYKSKCRHDAHHNGWCFNYGVTSPLWDVVFGTYYRGASTQNV